MRVGSCTVERVVEGLAGNVIAASYLSNGNSHIHQRSAGFNVFLVELALIDALSLGQLDPLALPLKDPRALELRHARQKREEKLLHGGAAVFGDGDALGDESDRAALFRESVDD